MNKRGELKDYLIALIVVIGIGALILVFYQTSLGTVGATLNANDVVVVAAAQGCSVDLSIGAPNLQNKFCYDFKTVKKKSFLGFSTQEVNCDYLNNTIKASIPKVDMYSTVYCPKTVWVERCQILLNENSNDESYEMLVNGKACSKKAMSNVYANDYMKFDVSVFDKSNNCIEIVNNTFVPKSIVVERADGKGIAVIQATTTNVYFNSYNACKSAPSLTA